jgi:hypothetical protein
MSDRDDALLTALASVFLVNGHRLQEHATALLDAMTRENRPLPERIRLLAAADQLSAALRELRASTGLDNPHATKQ